MENSTMKEQITSEELTQVFKLLADINKSAVVCSASSELLGTLIGAVNFQGLDEVMLLAHDLKNAAQTLRESILARMGER